MPMRVAGINSGFTLADTAKPVNDKIGMMANNMLSDSFLQVNSCGIFDHLTNSGSVKRSAGRKDYLIIFVSEGSTFVHAESGSFCISPGELFVIPPEVSHSISHEPGTSEMWVHFSGYFSENFMHQFGIKPFSKYTFSDGTYLWALAEKIINEYQLRKTGFILNSCAFFIQMITVVGRRIEYRSRATRAGNCDLSLAVEEMHAGFSDNKDIQEYARICGVSTSYFISRFTREYGISPYKYLTQIRISQAKTLLSETAIPVSEIAENVGYADPFCFSRLFRKYVGISPSGYRKQKKTEGMGS